MKRTIRIAIAALLLTAALSPTLTAQFTWEIVDPYPETADLLSVDMGDHATIVAVGRGGAILQSVDSGKTWTRRIGEVTSDLRAVAFVDPVAVVAVGVRGEAMRSLDGGAVWAERPTKTIADLNGIAPVKDTMVAVGDGGVMIRTLDWAASFVPLPSVTDADLHAIAFIPETESGIVVGDEGTVLRSDDAGATWRVIREGDEELTALSIVDAERWYAVGAGGEMIVTRDGGETWVEHPVESGYSYSALHMFDSLQGYALGHTEASGFPMASTRVTVDGGSTWIDIDPTLARVDGGLAFIDSRHGVLVGEAGSILMHYEENGEARLRSARMPAIGRYNAIALDPDYGVGLAVGNVIDMFDENHSDGSYEIVYRDETDDPLPSADSTILRYEINDAAAEGLSGSWIAVGDSGVVMTRGWQETKWRSSRLGSGTTRFVDVASLYDLASNDSTAAIVGLPTDIWLTTNTGTDWEPVSSPADGVTQLFWWDDTTLVAYARDANTLHTYSLRSREWLATLPLETGTIEHFEVVDSRTVIGFGSHRTPQSQGDRRNDLIVKTTDRGATWTTLLDEETGDSSFGLTSGDMGEFGHGVAVGPNRKMLVTSGGQWEVVEPPDEIFPPGTALVDVEMIDWLNMLIMSSSGHVFDNVDNPGSIIARYYGEFSGVDDDGSGGADDLDLTAYPNPTQGGTIRVRWEGSVFAGGLIATADGRIIGRVDAGTRSGDEIEVTMPELPSGVYHLLLRSEEGTREVPIIVTR